MDSEFLISAVGLVLSGFASISTVHHYVKLRNHNEKLQGHNKAIKDHNQSIKDHNQTIRDHNEKLQDHNKVIKEHTRTGWLRQQLYEKLDTLSEEGTNYWLEREGITTQSRQCSAVKIKKLLQDIEGGAEKLEIDITISMAKVSNLIMKEGFEHVEKWGPLPPTHENFYKIHAEINKMQLLIIPSK